MTARRAAVKGISRGWTGCPDRGDHLAGVVGRVHPPHDPAIAQQGVDLRADEQLVPGIEEAVPPAPRIAAARQSKLQATTERNGPESAQPAPVSRVPKLLEPRPAGPGLLSHRSRHRPHPAIVDVDKR